MSRPDQSPTPATADDDALLRDSWHRFCDDLKAAGELVFRETGPRGAVDKAVGMRLLARNVALALQFQLENNDPEYPELMRYFEPTRKQGGDNCDALYVGAPIDGQHHYRISGLRGDAPYFAVTVMEDGDTPWGGAVVGQLFGDQLAVDTEGRFELYLGPEPPADAPRANWIRTTPQTWRVTIRQFFLDWEHEEPMTARIDRLDGDPLLPPPVFTPQQLARGLAGASHWLRWSTGYWADMIDLWKARRNQFLAYGELENRKIDFTPGGVPVICFWELPEDEALIVRVRPPRADYWACEFGNYWWETVDYRYRQCSVNQHHKVLEDDGELIVVVSHDDPGLPNWLDPAGHSEGYITFRWIGADSSPRPEVTQVKRKDLLAALPDSVQRITPELRRDELRRKRIGISRRFRA